MKLYNGFLQLCDSLSGTFALLSLISISIITWHAPQIGAYAFVAFFPIVGGLLIHTENKEAMQQLQVAIPQPPKGRI